MINYKTRIVSSWLEFWWYLQCLCHISPTSTLLDVCLGPYPTKAHPTSITFNDYFVKTIWNVVLDLVKVLQRVGISDQESTLVCLSCYSVSLYVKTEEIHPPAVIQDTICISLWCIAFLNIIFLCSVTGTLIQIS